MPLLEVSHLRTSFMTGRGEVRAVDDLSLTIEHGETLCLVGESGCGKSVTALSIPRLLSPPGRIIGGEIIFEGTNLASLPEKEMRRIRGDQIAMIFQDPMTSLNPVMTIGEQITEGIRAHRDISRSEARDLAIAGMRDVAIPSPELRLNQYPHEMSGGMRQRVMIAMALACNPKLLIADEPTTALDVTIQAQILDLLNDLRQRRHLALLLITHDFGVVAEMADRVAVMYAGQIVEEAPVAEIFSTPQHPYTAGLLRAAPRPEERISRLATIEGTVPNMLNLPPACRFAPRCPHVEPACREQNVALVPLKPGHLTRCRRAGEIAFSGLMD